VIGAIDVLGRDGGELARQFDVAEEGNLTSWASSLLLLSAALLLAVAARTAKTAGDRDARWWWLLCGVFVYLSLDESASLHELLIEPVGSATDASGLFHQAWIIVAVPVVVVLGLVLLGFLRRLPSTTRRRFLVAGAVFLAGAVGFEALGGAALDAGLTAHGVNRVLVSMEETLENLGAALFIGALLRHLATATDGTLRIELR
jgi:uncharacterized membrane protein YhaH (DUF805 family)